MYMYDYTHVYTHTHKREEEMTVQEAIKELQVGYLGDTEEIVQAKHMGIKALEKQIPKKPIVKPTTKEIPKTHTLGRLLQIYCPVCGKRITALYESDLRRGCGLVRDVKGCPRCLQAIDFEGYYSEPKLDKSDEDIDWEEGGTSD